MGDGSVVAAMPARSMTNLLSRDNRQVLAQLASARALLAFDFDGTLAPILDRRDAARMRDTTASLVRSLCALYPCAVISGRARADVRGRLGSAAVRYVVGSHGLDTGANVDDYELEVGDARRILDVALRDERGVELEDKRCSLAIHYRSARRKRAAAAAIRCAIASLPTPMRIVPGKLVVNLMPSRAPNKADALLDLRAREGAEVAFYVGDDVTDEDVFRLDEPGRLVTVRVGASKSSAAAYYLRKQPEIDRLLSRLISLRAPER